MSEYKPAPLNVEGIELPESLGPVTERMAEHVHEVWASQRIAEGWKLGPERDDEKKEHPCLVPYDELPENERDYDRHTAINTLKLILKMGYQIVAPESAAPGEEAREELERMREVEERLRTKKPVIRTRELREFWQERTEHLWALQSNLFEILGDTLLKRGYPLWANEVLIEGLKVTPDSVRMRQLRALALMRTGRPRRARKIIEELIDEDEGNRTGETLGLLASSHKNVWSSTQDEEEKAEALAQCAEIYRVAFEETGDYYPGINAAAMALVSDDAGGGKHIAERVEEICRKSIEGGDKSYWTLATVAEAALIEGEGDRAAELYEEAVAAAPEDIASISATRKQALMLAKKLGIDDSAIRRALPVPPVAAFGGLPCWKEGEVFLPSIEGQDAFRDRIREEIRQSQFKVAYASGVGGGDLVFLETLLEEGGEAHLVLPAPADDLARLFHHFSGEGDAWSQRLNAILEQAASITVVSRELGSANAEVFEYANRILAGATVLRGKSLGTPVSLIELSGEDGEVFRAFPDSGRFQQIHRLATPGIHFGDPHPTSTSGLSAEIKGILFADLKGYSKMPEAEIPLFITSFLAEAAKLCDEEPGLQVRNTWGDAFYLVFDTVRTAAVFAKKLRSFVKDTDWLAKDFSNPFGIRIALHAGPLFGYDDPILKGPTFTGQHASRAARIEPITDEGAIFVSEPFACLAAEGGAPELEFEYLGRRALAKKYGGEGLFMLL